MSEKDPYSKLSIDRRTFISRLGGVAAVGLMSHEAKADALEHYLEERLYAQAEAPAQGSAEVFPTAAELKAAIPTRHYRRGAGGLFVATQTGAKVDMLPEMSAAPTLEEFFEKRFTRVGNHCLQSANKAMERGVQEEIILACLLHDTVQELIKVEHGWWGAQLYEPYVPEITSWAIRYHQALRFFPDEKAGYFYPDLYHRMFGHDYVPPPQVVATKDFALSHPWYYAAREVTVSDLYAFDPNAVVSLDKFRDLIRRHFKQPKEGLGYDNSPVAHMWRSMANPDAPL
ncbi:MAG: hypothetical protein LBF16_09245 [Pseudomonadales bacterium]|jgi:hypothetical protein|nr:hypothetical protein [Pseudomonadales bacterium]